MKWEDVGKILAKNGLNLLADVIPGGHAITRIISDILGVNNDPDQVYMALQTASPDKFVELMKAQSDNETELRKARIEADSAIIGDVNETMQKESESEHWAQWAWRPFWGFISGIAFLFVCILVGSLAYKAVGKADVNAMNMVPTLITSFTNLFAIPGAILGISAWHRGKEKIEKIKQGLQ